MTIETSSKHNEIAWQDFDISRLWLYVEKPGKAFVTIETRSTRLKMCTAHVNSKFARQDLDISQLWQQGRMIS